MKSSWIKSNKSEERKEVMKRLGAHEERSDEQYKRGAKLEVTSCMM